MRYEALVKEIDVDEHEGHLNLKIGDFDIKTYYFAPNEYIKANIHKNDKITIDLWMVIAAIKKVMDTQKLLVCDKDEDLIRGEIKSILSNRELQVDCGILIDVENEDPINDFHVGDFIETNGDYQIYFPDSKWDREPLE